MNCGRSGQPPGYASALKLLGAKLLPVLACLMFHGTASAAPSAKAVSAPPDTVPASLKLNSESLTAGQVSQLTVSVEIPAGFHAQSHTPNDPGLIRFEVVPTPAASIRFGEPNYPPGRDETYGQLGKLNVYTGKIETTIPVEVSADAAPGGGTLEVNLTLQMCDDQSCYPPINQTLRLTIPLAPGNATQTTPKNNAPAATIPAKRSPAKRILEKTIPAKADLTTLTVFGMALLAGLLFNVMPCVLPVLPLKAMGFYEVSQHHRARSVLLGLVFSLGIIAAFTVLALLLLVFRAFSWGELFGHAWFVWTIVAVLGLLGVSMLGGWNLSLPMGVYTFQPRHDTLGGNFFWGVLTTVLATPCTAPLLPAVLGWAATHPVYIGIPAVMCVGVGMALPYLLLSATPELARRFPRTGPWSELFKQMMGFLLIASATYFAAGRLIGGDGFWWAVVAVVALAALFLLARVAQLSDSSVSAFVAALLAVAMIGGAAGWTIHITGGFGSPSNNATYAGYAGSPSIGAAAVLNGANPSDPWEPFTTARFDALRKAGTPVLVKFTANWCITCQFIEGNVYRDPTVWATLRAKHIATLKVDLTNAGAPGSDLLRTLNPAGGIPLTAIWPPGMDEPIQLSSVYDTATLMNALEPIGTR